MLQSSWSIKLSQQPTLITFGTLPQPSIIYQSTSQHLLVHSNNSSTSLPIRKDLLALQVIGTSAKNKQQYQKNQNGSKNKDKILMLTRYQLSCWDILNNTQIFSLEFQNAEALFVTYNKIYVICGSDLHSYYYDGEQIEVNHMPCNITSILPNQNDQVLVCMSDMTMLLYKGVNIKYDYGKVIGVICSLDWIAEGVIVGSQEGTIAYYQSKKSKWKAKSTHKPIKIISFKNNNHQELAIVGRQSGLIQLRDWGNGSTVSKIKTGQPIISMNLFDYRKQGFQQIICACKTGDIKSFNSSENIVKQQKPQFQLASQLKVKQKNIQNIISQKVSLEYEVNQLKQILRNTNFKGENQQNQGLIVKPQCTFGAILIYDKGLKVTVNVQHGYICGLSFEEPIMPIQTEKSQSLSYVFTSQNKIAGQINCEALITSNFSSKICQIRKFKITLPKFWKWGLDPNVRSQISSCVKFKLNQRNTRFLKWMHQCFFVSLSQIDTNRLQSSSIMKVRFYNYYQDLQMEIVVISKQAKVQIWCDDLKILGDIVQDLVQFIGITDLDSELHFPKQKQKLKGLLDVIQKLSQTKIAISSQMAEAINVIKFLLVKGESARMVSSMKDLRKSYGQVMQQNRNLISQISKKNQNTQQLADAMKNLGLMINQTSNVRFGQPKTKLVSQCRQAIKNKDFPKIIALMERGAMTY